MSSVVAPSLGNRAHQEAMAMEAKCCTNANMINSGELSEISPSCLGEMCLPSSTVQSKRARCRSADKREDSIYSRDLDMLTNVSLVTLMPRRLRNSGTAKVDSTPADTHTHHPFVTRKGRESAVFLVQNI